MWSRTIGMVVIVIAVMEPLLLGCGRNASSPDATSAAIDAPLATIDAPHSNIDAARSIDGAAVVDAAENVADAHEHDDAAPPIGAA